MKDLTGVVLAELRANIAIAAIVGARIWVDEVAPSDEWATGGRTDPRPFVLLESLGPPSRFPFGRGSGRIGLQNARYAVHCYGAPDANDPRVARRTSAELRGAVSDAFHLRGPRRGTSGRLIHESLDDGGGRDVDPDTDWPRETVILSITGAAQAVA